MIRQKPGPYVPVFDIGMLLIRTDPGSTEIAPLEPVLIEVVDPNPTFTVGVQNFSVSGIDTYVFNPFIGFALQFEKQQIPFLQLVLGDTGPFLGLRFRPSGQIYAVFLKYVLGERGAIKSSARFVFSSE